MTEKCLTRKRIKEGIAQVSGTSEQEAESVYLNYAKSSMLTFQALIAFNDEDFESALKACDECLTICNARVSETWMEQISGTFSDEKYKYWDDEKLHAMLVRAEILFFKTALLACSSGTDLMAIAKICIFSRDSYKLFEKCLDIADIRPWKSETLRKEFLNGAKFGIGMFKVSLVVFFVVLGPISLSFEPCSLSNSALHVLASPKNP